MIDKNNGGKLSPELRTKCEIWSRLKFLLWVISDLLQTLTKERNQNLRTESISKKIRL